MSDTSDASLHHSSKTSEPCKQKVLQRGGTHLFFPQQARNRIPQTQTTGMQKEIRMCHIILLAHSTNVWGIVWPPDKIISVLPM